MRRPALSIQRAGAYVASAALTISGSVLAVSPAEAFTYDPQPAASAGDWLTGQLTSGLLHNNNFGGFDDYGLSIDAALALAALGGHDATVRDISDAVAAHIGAYTGTGGEVYAGAMAKAAVLAQTAGADATSYGGTNLIAQLESTVSSAAPINGRLVDASSFGDYANTLGQAFAANSLERAGATKATSVTDFLLKQQCSSGYFRLNFTASKTATKQSCVDGVDTADADATAVSVLQLSPQSADARVAAALARAKTWLRAQQRCDGSFGGGTSTTGSNANSTGLAAWTLGDSPASRQAAVWLRAHQATAADSSNSLARQAGAIAYDNAGLATGRSKGITDANSDQWRRATAQSTPGIRWYSTDPTPAIALTGPTGYVRAGTRAVMTASGAAAGTVLCVTGPSTSARRVVGSAPWIARVTLPAGTATRSYTVRDAFGHSDAAMLKVLGAKKLRVTTSRHRVKRSRYVTVTVSGLAPREWARIAYRGRFLRSGHATWSGKFTAALNVGRHKGKRTFTGYGQFRDIRRGTAVIRVVR